MSNEWDEYAQSWDANPSVVEYADKAFQTLQENVRLDGVRVLDFGAGTGLLTQRLHPQAKQLVALDGSEKMLQVLAGKTLEKVSIIDELLTPQLIETHPLLQEKFDLILASSALAFVDNYPQTLTLLASLIKENGKLVQWDWLKQESEDGKGFSVRQIESAYQESGLKLASVSHAFSMGEGEDAMPVLMAVATKIENSL